MSRLRQTLAVSLMAVAAASAGCAHCSTCADFPAPGYPTGYQAPMSVGGPMIMGPVTTAPATSAPVDSAAPAPPTLDSKPVNEASGVTNDATPPAPQLPQVNPER